MKRLLLYGSILLLMSQSVHGQMITFESLLKQMPDNTNLAHFPTSFYQSLESSSYNRASVSPFKRGWFADGDGSGYIRKDTINGKTEYVIMEHQGPGCITRMWTPYFYDDLNNHTGPHIHIYLDGNKAPIINKNFIKLLTGKSFVKPPFAELTTRAGVCYLPIPFSKSCIVTLDQKSFYYCIAYRAYPKKTKVKSFSMKDYTTNLQLIKETGDKLESPPPQKFNHLISEMRNIKSDDSVTISLPYGSSAIRFLQFKLDTPLPYGLLRNILLKISFDGNMAIWCPLGDFFCSADIINDYHTRFITVKNNNTLISHWVMPYKDSAKITLINYSHEPFSTSVKIGTAPWEWNDQSMYFHTNWIDYGYLPGNKFFDLNFITAKGKGVIVGDALTVLSPSEGWWGEGDEKIYIDKRDIDRHFPSQFGTGTEDYYGWAGGVIPTRKDTFSVPFGSNVRIGNKDNPRGYNICTRVRMLDNIPFDDELKFDMEASPGVDIRHFYDLLAYSMVTYWYGLPDASSNQQYQLNKVKQKLMPLATLDVLENQLKAGHIHIGSSYILNK